MDISIKALDNQLNLSIESKVSEIDLDIEMLDNTLDITVEYVMQSSYLSKPGGGKDKNAFEYDFNFNL